MRMNVLLIYIFTVTAAYAQQNGDVRLAGGSSRKGRVELYLNGIWGTVDVRGGLLSGRQRRRWAAHAVCRQLGFPESSDRGNVGDLNIQPAGSNVPRVIDELYCGEFRGSGRNRNEVDSRNLHILRCDYDVVSQPSNPDHDDDFAVECNPLDETEDGYDTEVRLVQGGTGFSSSGFVEIFFRDSWGPVCNIESLDADSACRQLGYTNAASFSSDSSYDGDGSGGKLDSFFCTESRPCLRDCFDFPMLESERFNCTDYSIVNCTFDVSEEDSFSSGDNIVCTNKGLIIALAVGLSIGGVVLLMVVGFCSLVIVGWCCMNYPRECKTCCDACCCKTKEPEDDSYRRVEDDSYRKVEDDSYRKEEIDLEPLDKSIGTSV